ncbi:hypothetical protein [Lactococcus lactis]|uniref:hypothetical protein n=1 Tax=Lactococcus lactis TaxID=1358 RepID=UPI0024A8257C|nr:hypothetical protein [Lactococcus lactis]
MSKMDNEKLDHLILETWTDFIDLKNKAELSEVLIPNSMPLLWFGDLAKYEKSDLKILTVSKNASYAEFGENQRYEKITDRIFVSKFGNLQVKSQSVF